MERVGRWGRRSVVRSKMTEGSRARGGMLATCAIQLHTRYQRAKELRLWNLIDQAQLMEFLPPFIAETFSVLYPKVSQTPVFHSIPFLSCGVGGNILQTSVSLQCLN